MYNESIKNEFLSSMSESSSKVYKTLFRRTNEIELKYNKDVYDMPIDELIECIKYSGSSNAIRKPNISRLRKYTYWCCLKGLSTINQLDKNLAPTEVLLDSIDDEEQLYITEEDFEKYYNDLIYIHNDVLVASVFIACYEGIAGHRYENMINAQMSDISDDKSYIKLKDGNTVRLNENYYDILKEVSDITGRTTEYGFIPFRVESIHPDSIWRFGNARSYNYYCQKAFNLLGKPKMNKISLEKSGVFNRVIKYCRDYDLSLKDDMTMTISKRDAKPRQNAKYEEMFKCLGLDLTFSRFKTQYFNWIKYI